MSTPAIAQWGDHLRVRYALRLRDGTVLFSTLEDAPDSLTLGDDSLAPGLAQCLVGLSVGERHVFLLESWQAFGQAQDELVQTLPRSDVPADFPLQEDTLVEFALPNGQTLAGRILTVNDTQIRVDFNHPLAGVALAFEVEIDAIEPR
jgi:FKBP-type peptidyl-prolyl cis-trans isomerase SlpA